MDKSLKLLIGVLSIAGLLALLVPTSVPAPPPQPAAATAVNAPVITPTVTDENMDVELEESDLAEDAEEVEFFKFGEPTIDGKPYGESNDSTAEISNNNMNPQSGSVAVNAPEIPQTEMASDTPLPPGN